MRKLLAFQGTRMDCYGVWPSPGAWHHCKQRFSSGPEGWWTGCDNSFLLSSARDDVHRPRPRSVSAPSFENVETWRRTVLRLIVSSLAIC